MPEGTRYFIDRMACHSVAACRYHLLFFHCECSVSALLCGFRVCFDRTYARVEFARFFTQFRGRLIGRTPAFEAGYHGSSPCPGATFLFVLWAFDHFSPTFSRLSFLRLL
jgi:hypothetical protein